MNLHDEVDQYPALVGRVTAVARRTPSFGFCDLLWPPTPGADDLIREMTGDPGVMFETGRRILVFHRVGGELRYYAGGWCPGPDCASREDDRIRAEGCELGVFASAADALAFADGYLVGGLSFAAVRVPRSVLYGCAPEEGEPGCRQS